jgi:hypothetical protein
MPVNVFFDDHWRIVQVDYFGLVSRDELFEIFEEAVICARKNSTLKFLADCTGMTGGHTLVDLFNFVSQFVEREMTLKMKEAIVMPVSSMTKPQVEYYQKACQSHGFNVRVFSNRDEAINWLSESS